MACAQKDLDLKYLRRCFTLARKAGVKTYPNPLVGAVVVKNGRVSSKVIIMHVAKIMLKLMP